MGIIERTRKHTHPYISVIFPSRKRVELLNETFSKALGQLQLEKYVIGGFEKFRNYMTRLVGTKPLKNILEKQNL